MTTDARAGLSRCLAPFGIVLTIYAMPHAWAGPVEEFERARKYAEQGDVVRAMPILRKLSDSGYAPAQVKLADMLDKAEENEAAVALYRKAAHQGDPDALFGLASMIAAGEGAPRNPEESLRLLRIAAGKSHMPSIHALAQAYLSASPALKASPDFAMQAVQWNTLAADGGYIPAMDALARAYRVGDWNVATDAARSEAWERRADAARRALAGSSRAQPGKH